MCQVPSTVHAVQRPMMRARCQCHECFLRKTELFRAFGISIQSLCIWFSVVLQIVLSDVYFTVFCSKPFWSQICKETFGNVCISASAVASCKDQCSACLPVIRAMFSLSAGCKNNFLRRRSFTRGRKLPLARMLATWFLYTLQFLQRRCNFFSQNMITWKSNCIHQAKRWRSKRCTLWKSSITVGGGT